MELISRYRIDARFDMIPRMFGNAGWKAFGLEALAFWKTEDQIRLH